MLSTKLKEAAGNSADATLYVDDVFSTYLYTGNGSTQTITNGIDLAGKGGMVWTKDRTQANNNVLQDTINGVASVRSSNLTSGNLGYTDNITAFSSTGYSIGAGSEVNNSGGGGSNYVSWTFREAPKFFDIVTYTGNGVAGRSIAHNLGIAPGMIVVKRTDVAGNNWWVYHRSLGAFQAMSLNTTDAVNATAGGVLWNNTEPTSTVFTLGTNGGVNDSGGTYVAYLYAHDTDADGIIQCGSYTGNGSATGPTVSLGWEPQYLMVKNISGYSNWQLLDSMRGIPVGSADATLQANLANAESSVGYVSPTATGFQITSTDSQVNTSGSTYIYMAIRMPNKPPTSGTQVYAPVLNTGNNTAGTILTAGFPVDLNIGTIRTPDYSFVCVMDRLRGATKLLQTGTTSIEGTDATGITSFANQTGVVVGTGANNSWPNQAPWTYVNWMFKRAPGFFDEVCFTASGSNFTVTHNLGAVPDLVITKCRSGANTDWNTYASPIGNTKNLVVNATSPAYTLNVWQNTTPTATSLFLTGGGDYFSMGQTYVAYLFATLAGISKVGSYTGNGTGQAIACGFSGGARFVLIKRTDATGGWYTFDSARGLTSGSSPYLLLNTVIAEVTGNNGVYASSGGFTLGATAITTTNIVGASYIYLSVA